jgi:hypothetical protein
MDAGGFLVVGKTAGALIPSSKFKNERRYTSTPPLCFHGMSRDVIFYNLREKN